MVSRWTPETRSVLRIEEPSVSRERQRTAFSMSRRMVPNGLTGTRATVTPQDLQRRRALPWRSLPHPIVRPPQDRQAVPSGAVMGSVGAFMARSLICCYCRHNNPTYQ